MRTVLLSHDSLHRRCCMLWSPQANYEGLVSLTIAVRKRPVLTSFRHSPGKYPSHTVHVDDIAGAMWAAAEWMAKTGRKEADAIAGEEIVFKNEKSKVAEVEGMIPHTQKVIAPLFNVVSCLRYSPAYVASHCDCRRTTRKSLLSS